MKRLACLLAFALTAAACLACCVSPSRPAAARASEKAAAKPPAKKPVTPKYAYGLKLGGRRGCGCQAPYYAPVQHLLGAPPPRVDLRPGMPPVYDQGQLGSCTANAIGAAVHYDELRQGVARPVQPSRLFLYYLERTLEGSIHEDAGAYLADGVRVLSQWGYCDEQLWPYDIDQFTRNPSRAAYAAAAKAKVRDYAKVRQDRAHMQAALAAGHPVVIGFTVYESFESEQVAETGVVPMPGPKEEVLGGHAVLIVGYDGPTQRYIVRNSWGEDWGDRGYFTVPQAYFEDPRQASDLWVVNTVPPPKGR